MVFISLICARLVNADRSRGRDLVEGPDTADSVPGVFLVGLFALAFVPFQEAGNKELPGQVVSFTRPVSP